MATIPISPVKNLRPIVDSLLTHKAPDELHKLMILVDQGNPEAQYHLACLYLLGLRGLEINIDRAVELFSMSASAGFPQSMINLAVHHVNGLKQYRNDNDHYHHIPDYKKAAQLIQNSAQLGFPAGMYKLGQYYLFGTGVVQNYLEALRWLNKSSQYGIPDAFYYLGVMHNLGLGIEVDLIEAHKFFNLTVTYSSAELEIHKKSIEFRQTIEESLNKNELNEAQDRALKLTLIPLPEESKLKLYGTQDSVLYTEF